MSRYSAILAVTPFLIAVARQNASGAERPSRPGWLRPDPDGWVEHFTRPSLWPERLERVWQIEIGTGYGSPVVSGDRVFQHARQGEDEVVW